MAYMNCVVKREMLTAGLLKELDETERLSSMIQRATEGLVKRKVEKWPSFLGINRLGNMLSPETTMREPQLHNLTSPSQSVAEQESTSQMQLLAMLYVESFRQVAHRLPKVPRHCLA